MGGRGHAADAVRLEGMALRPLSWGVDVVIGVAEEVASWPGRWSCCRRCRPASLALITLGGLWLCIWRRRLAMARLLAGIGAGTGGDADGARFPTCWSTAPAGCWPRAPPMAVCWSRRKASAAPPARPGCGGRAPTATAGYWPKQRRERRRRATLRRLGCVYRANEHVVAVARGGEALLEDCRLADVVISLVPVRGVLPVGAAP